MRSMHERPQLAIDGLTENHRNHFMGLGLWRVSSISID